MVSRNHAKASKMGHQSYDYGKKRQTKAKQRRADWWRVWPWIIAGGLLTAAAVYIAFTK